MTTTTRCTCRTSCGLCIWPGISGSIFLSIFPVPCRHGTVSYVAWQEIERREERSRGGRGAVINARTPFDQSLVMKQAF